MNKIIVISLLCFGAIVAEAQIPQPDPDTTGKHFLIVASIGNMQEMSAGQLASQKASRPDVKVFGKMMVTDHQQAENKLLQLAKAKGITLPEESTGGIQPDLLLKNATAAFDRLYVHAMVVNHLNTVHTFQNYSITGKDPDVRALATQLLPTLKSHLEEIENIDLKLKEASK